MVKIYQKYASSPALGIVASGLGNSLLSPSGQWAIVPALEDVHVWDVKTGSLIQTCRVSETASSLKNPPIVTCLCAHGAAAKEMIYSVGYSDGSIRLWDLGSPDHQPVLIQTLQGHSKAVTALSYSHHDRLLVSGSKDTDVIVWDLVAESGLFRLKKCHRDEITALVWISCDSNAKPTHLVSASKDSLIKVWDLKTQHCVETVLTHRGAVHSLDWIASESLLLSGSEDGQVRAWSVDLKTLSTKLDMEEEEESSKGAKEEEAAIKRALVLQGTLERASKEKVLHIKSLSKGDASFLAVQVGHITRISQCKKNSREKNCKGLRLARGTLQNSLSRRARKETRSKETETKGKEEL